MGVNILLIENADDIITAEEKQATRSGICFSAVINEQAPDEIGQRARKRGLASLDDIMNDSDRVMNG